MSEYKLSILIATLGRRQDKFNALVESLRPQIENQPVEIIAFWNNGEEPIGYYRDQLLKEAKGEYVCFVDDDDRVPKWYVEEILNNTGADYIGFQVELFNDGELMPPVFHSIKYGVWHQDEDGYYRGVTHLNPIRRSLALKSKFTGGKGEDENWAIHVTPFVRTEKYINRIMYYYHHDKSDTFFDGDIPKPQTRHRPNIEFTNFKYHPKSKKAGQS